MQLKKKLSRRILTSMLAFIFIVLIAPGSGHSASSLPPPPSSKPPVRPDASEERRAWELYQLMKRDNRRLTWDQCLSRKALLRAKHLVSKNYFDHHDPKTGKNPAWQLVQRCYECRRAGENLVKGMGDSENIHKALMKSASHRKNIIDPGFSRVGIACYDYICVQLFAGF